MAADKRSDDRVTRVQIQGRSGNSIRIAGITLQAVGKIPQYLVSSKDIV
jgi:hypothetical protein